MSDDQSSGASGPPARVNVSPDEELAQHYLVEILSRARTVEGRCRRLLEHDFVSEAPRALAETIRRAASFLSRAAIEIYRGTPWGKNPRDVERRLGTLRKADTHLQMFAEHLRYIEGARTDRLPWSIIPSFERFVRSALGDVQVMLRAMWHYNYAFWLADLSEVYHRFLVGYLFYLPTEDLKGHVLERLSKPFHIISFPSLERKHILLHSTLGHEIGHLLVHKFLTPQRETAFANRIQAKVAAQVDDDIQKQPATIGQNLGAFRPQMISEYGKLALKYWRRALEELLSDAAGVMLFGPAALLSTLDIAMQEGYDAVPSESECYPPWRRRIRNILEVLDTQGVWFPVEADVFMGSDARASRVNDRVTAIRDLVSDKADETAVGSIPLAKIAYDELATDISDGIKFLLNDCDLQRRQPVPEELYRAIPPLVERLDNQVPPNAVEESGDMCIPASFVGILNAAWLRKLSLAPFSGPEGLENGNVIRDRNRMNNLTLKAIEYANLSQEYSEWRAQFPAKSVPSDDAVAEREGVLTRGQILDAMRRKLADRLIVTPILDVSESIGPSSVDVRLGGEFILFKRESFPQLDILSSLPSEGTTVRPSHELRTLETGPFQQRVVRPIGRPFVLHPRQLVIGATLEYIQVPKGLMCYVVGKSGWGRMGLIIATATKVDPGFRGCITLEIVNDGEIPLILYPGLPIAQLVFHETTGASVYDGAYNCPVGPQFPELSPKPIWGFWKRKLQF